ncbi:MAG: PIG-L deacetylase family protein [bacterium]|nr:PIG-L deacetylase family protein [bacterium]
MRKTLIIAPHMDDEIMGVGGTICREVREGTEVRVCFVCNRAYDHAYDPLRINEEKHDALAAKEILGYQEHVFLDFDDERLYEKLLDTIVALEKVVAEFKPTCVYLPHRADNNQDHRTVFDAAMVAFRSFATPSVEEIYSYEVSSSTEQTAPFAERVFIPNVYINIEQFVEQKKLALNCYKRETRDFPHPRSIKAVEILAMKRGIEIHCQYAEAFEAVRIIKR